MTASPADPDPATSLYEEALERGHEGLMVKDTAAAYQPGRRVGRVLKLEPTMEPLDLVATRAKYSEGRRSELPGRLSLACYDPEPPGTALRLRALRTDVTVQYRDGIEIHLSDGTRVVCDADEPPSGSSANRTSSSDADEPPSGSPGRRGSLGDTDSPDGDVAVVSHAHGDHLPVGEATAVCSPLTADLATARRDVPLHATTDERVELLPAGHVAGSTAALVTDPDGTRYLYTGDVCTRSRFYLDGFEPVDADVLITETTYGEPEYVFPDHETVASDIVSWLRETDEPVLLFGYALGRAQKLQLFAREASRKRLFTTDAVLRVNDVVESHLDVSFDAERYDAETELGEGDALVLPMPTTRIDWIRRLAEETGAVKAGFSGWAIEDAFTFRGDFDVTFPLSDHCDFAELRDLVDAVDPDRVYTQHGSTDAFAETLTRRGYEATALRRNQTALGDF